MSENVVVIGSRAWAADLQQFRDAISSIASEKQAVQDDFDEIISLLNSLQANWDGPAGWAFAAGPGPLASAGQQMIDVITDVIKRLGMTLQNYEDAEIANTKNLS